MVAWDYVEYHLNETWFGKNIFGSDGYDVKNCLEVFEIGYGEFVVDA